MALRWAGAIVVLVALAGGIWLFARPHPVPVTLVTVTRGPVEATVANTRAGTVKACRRARMAPSGGGRIARLDVKEGDRVRKGQVLLEIWNADKISQVRVAEAHARASALHADEVCAVADTARREAERARELQGQGFVSQERAERAVADARAREAACAAARAEVRHAHAAVGAAKTELDRTVMRAPFSGIVAEVTGEVGEYTTPSPPGIPTPPAIDLIDDSCLYVDAAIDEVNAPAIRLGMPARITIDAFPGEHFAARVRRIAPYVLDVEKQARTVDVEVEFKRPADIKRLLVGYSADIEIVLKEREDALRIPTSALFEGKRVLVYRPETGRLEARHIQTGLSNWQYTEVLSGLKAGDRIAASLEREGVQAGARVVPEVGQ